MPGKERRTEWQGVHGSVGSIGAFARHGALTATILPDGESSSILRISTANARRVMRSASILRTTTANQIEAWLNSYEKATDLLQTTMNSRR